MLASTLTMEERNNILNLQRAKRFIRRAALAKATNIQTKAKIQSLLEQEKELELAYQATLKKYLEMDRTTAIADLKYQINELKIKYPTTELNEKTLNHIDTLIKELGKLDPDTPLDNEYVTLISNLITKQELREDTNENDEPIVNNPANNLTHEIGIEIYKKWLDLTTLVDQINLKENVIKNSTPEILLNAESEGYIQLVNFLKDQTTILPVIGCSATEIIGNEEHSDLNDYAQLLNIITSNIRLDITPDDRSISIPSFNLEKVAQEWNKSKRKRADNKSNYALYNQPQNWGLKDKFLRNLSTRTHLLKDDEIQAVINNNDLQNCIHVSITKVDSIIDKLKIAAAKAGEEKPYTFYLILSDAKINTNLGSHWTSAKITVTESEVAIEYADSNAFLLNCPTELITAVESHFKLKAKVSKQDKVTRQPNGFECGYLALYNCIRHVKPDSLIGLWSNEADNIPLLRKLIQTDYLEKLRLSKEEINESVCEAVEEENQFKFKLAYIQDSFAGKNTDSPLLQLNRDCIKLLEDYKLDRFESIAFDCNPSSYSGRLTWATNLIRDFKNCHTNSELSSIFSLLEIYIPNLTLSNPSSKLKTIMESIKIKISARLSRDYVDARNDINADGFFEKIKNMLRTIPGAAHEVDDDKNSWHGQEWLIRDGIQTDELHHTIKDQLFGKLHFIMNDKEMDDPTKITEMRLTLAQTLAAVTPYFGTGSQFYRALLSLNAQLNSPSEISGTLVSTKSCTSKTQVSVQAYRSKLTTEASFPKEFRTTWNKGKNPIEAMFSLLDNYAMTDDLSLFFHGKWLQTHHATLARATVKHFRERIENGQNVSPQEVLDQFANQLNWEQTKPCGKLMRILRFCALKTNSEFYLCLNKPVARPLTSG